MTKKPFPVVARSVLTFLTIAGLFCALTGCRITLREATNPSSSFFPETEHTPVNAKNPSAEEPEPLKPPVFPTESENAPPPKQPEINEEAEKWIQRYAQSGNPQRVVLNAEEIDALNAKIRVERSAMRDMTDVPDAISGSEIEEIIRMRKAPSAPMYDKDGRWISEEQKRRIDDNRNLDAVPQEIVPQTGIATRRANVRALPTAVGFYEENDKMQYYDQLQESELILGSPVWVLHESSDGGFYFVQTGNYQGWVEKTAVATTDRETYRKFLPQTNVSMVCITAEHIDLSETQRLDMGAVFPYLSSSEDYFEVALPCRDENGALFTQTVSIEKSQAHYGYLPYTMENFYVQAFKFYGIEYSWGGFQEGVDCSGLVCAVFRSFGVQLPRNTGEQKEYGGTIVSFSGMTTEQIRDALKKIDCPAALHRKGHVMLYLGSANDRIYVLHAPQGGQSVEVMELSRLDDLLCAAIVN